MNWYVLIFPHFSLNLANGQKLICKRSIAPTSRLTASINASHVMAAFELVDT